MVDVAIKASQITNSVIVVTGKIDYVTDGKTCYSIDNGVAEMQLVTGCGCMLTGLLSAGAVPQQITFRICSYNNNTYVRSW